MMTTVNNTVIYTAICGFPVGASRKNLPANAGDMRDVGSIPRSGRCPGGEHGKC